MKIQVSLIFALLFTFLLPNQAEGQFITKKGRKYIQEDKIYAKEDLGIVFENSPQAMNYYKKGISKGKTARTLFTVGTTMIGVSFMVLGLAVVTDSNDGSIDETTLAALLFSTTMFSVGIIVDLISIPIYSSARSNMNNAVNHYNWEIENQTKKEIGSFHLGVTNHGLGLVYSF